MSEILVAGQSMVYDKAADDIDLAVLVRSVTVTMEREELEVTTISKLARQRVLGLWNGALQFNILADTSWTLWVQKMRADMQAGVDIIVHWADVLPATSSNEAFAFHGLPRNLPLTIASGTILEPSIDFIVNDVQVSTDTTTFADGTFNTIFTIA